MRKTGVQFFNTSALDLPTLLDDTSNLADQLRQYIAGFSDNVREIFEKFNFDVQITWLDQANLLYLVLSKFVEIDLHPDTVSNLEMGYLYEELIRKFSELSNETAGEHFTPREVIELMVHLLFIDDEDLLSKPGICQDDARPRVRDWRNAVGLRALPPRVQPAGAAAGVRPGAQRRDLCDLPGRHALEGP
jgi:type I restriction enzyme M protein